MLAPYPKEVRTILKDDVMATKLNLHKLIGVDAGYLHSIRVEREDRDELAEAREEIRTALRDAFRNWEQFVTRAELRDSAFEGTGYIPNLPAPKFRIQGSFAYHTANDCQNPPNQQIDQDDGVFLPLSFVMVKGFARPTIASTAYFQLVERALAPLCEEKGWILNPNEMKNSCVRIEIGPRLHIDLPLYAIRDDAFDRLVSFASDHSLQKSIQLRDSRELDEQIYRDLQHAEIILAHRRYGWIESDPRRLETWFDTARELYGPVRELSRCFKGVRDAKFDEGLSSICLMASVVRAVATLGGVDDKRLDLAMVAVAREMARQVNTPVENPVFPGDRSKYLCLGWTDEYRNKVKRLFEETADELETAIDGTFHKAIALGHARNALGNRVPMDETLVVMSGAAEAVRSIAPERQPEPMVPRTKSG